MADRNPLACYGAMMGALARGCSELRHTRGRDTPALIPSVFVQTVFSEYVTRF